MDSFFVEVERLHDDSLRGIPVAVGGTGPRGVIASASYEARQFGVRSAQPTAMALKACPHLVVVHPSHGRYGEVSARVFEIFRSFTPLVEGLSLDEAFLDVSGLRRHFGSPIEVGQKVRETIKGELGLPSSVGVAANKLVAKLASEAAKPDGLKHVPVREQTSFLDSLKVTALPGVGPATLASLQRLGIVTVADLAAIPEPTLARAIGPTHAHHLHQLASGQDSRPVQPDIEAKSISVEETYPKDLEGIEVLETALLAHAHRLSMRLRRSGVAARTVTLKVRYAGFETVTRSRTGEKAIQGWRDLSRIGGAMLRELAPDRPVRLLGLGGSGLVRAGEIGQLDLEGSAEWDRVEDAVSSIRDRFGDAAINPARLIDD